MTPERAALEQAIRVLVRDAATLSLAADALERRALAAEAEARVLRERLEAEHE